MEELLLTPEAAARLLSLGRSKIFELMAAGELESITIGKSRRVPVEAIKEYVARQRQAQGSIRTWPSGSRTCE
ncbi:MAG: helix-turn-helix domain-containing protein [Chloroflexota bacterium]